MDKEQGVNHVNNRHFTSFSRRERALLKRAIRQNECGEIERIFAGQASLAVVGEKAEQAALIEKNCFQEISELQYAYETRQREALLTLLRCGADPALRLRKQKRSLLEQIVASGDDVAFCDLLPFLHKSRQPQMFSIGKYRICTTFMGLCAGFGRINMAEALKSRGDLLTEATGESLQGNAALPIWADGHIVFEEISEPWRLAVLCKDHAAAEFFFQQGHDQPAESWGWQICLTQDMQRVSLLKKYFPKMMRKLQQGDFRHFILESANAVLLSDADTLDWNASRLGLHSESESDIWNCFWILKKKLSRPFTVQEKKRLVVLALTHRSERLLRICEEEWNTEREGCDVTDCIECLPLYDREDRAFAEMLAASPLRLSIHPEQIDCDLHWQLFQNQQLSTLYKITQGQKAPASASCPIKQNAFVQSVLHMRTKTALNRLIQWELIHPGNVMDAVDFITEHRLTELYDPIIACACRMRA